MCDHSHWGCNDHCDMPECWIYRTHQVYAHVQVAAIRRQPLAFLLKSVLNNFHQLYLVRDIYLHKRIKHNQPKFEILC